jgi:hypothetical protein
VKCHSAAIGIDLVDRDHVRSPNEAALGSRCAPVGPFDIPQGHYPHTGPNESDAFIDLANHKIERSDSLQRRDGSCSGSGRGRVCVSSDSALLTGVWLGGFGQSG